MGESGTTSGPELLVTLDRSRGEPLHRQLADELRSAIRTARLAPDSRMPATRVLAADLGVSRRLVVEVYSQLTAEGYLHSRHGSGTRVARVDSTTRPPALKDDGGVSHDIDLSPGTPDLSSFPRTMWLRAMRQALAHAPSGCFDYSAPQGIPQARQALSDYLRRTRGVLADPARVVMCSGVTQGLALVAQTLKRANQLPIAIEDPTFSLHRKVLRYNASQPFPIPVDEEGLDVRALADSPARAVVTTPAHQSATGVVLSAGRRAALAGWARAGNLVIEDDYDAEYRYDRAPVGAVQAIIADRVIYLGSASKTLAPGLRLGWIVAPPHLVDSIIAVKSLADMGSSVTDQLAFTQVLATGDYDRHLRQMRRRYRRRRDALLAALTRHFPDATVIGASAGIQLSVLFPPGYPIATLVSRASASGVKVQSLASLYAEHRAARPGLQIGYANASEAQITDAVQRLAAVAPAPHSCTSQALRGVNPPVC